MEQIKQKWNAARKVYGLSDEISTASGMRIKGRYVLTDADAATPSHDPLCGFRKSDGFPTDANGQSVNDRDYERDTDAQRITRDIASNYDSRALQSPVVVSSDGIVLSGNGRTMAGILAAKNDSDAAYVGYLMQFSEKYGFKPDEIAMFRHPRVLFLTNDAYDYTAETFALFNAQEIKSQSKTEQAVKLGKLVDDATFARIVRNINQFDTISDFYGNVKASTDAIRELLQAGVISQMQYPEMFDGDSISNQAKDILENVPIGKAFSKNADAVRQITQFKGVRRNVITALAEISNNIALADSLERETADAIALCYQARSNGNIGHGEIVSGFARQTTMFAETQTVADHTNPVVMFLADLLNHSQVTRLKKVFALYNREARDAASGQVDMFSGGVKSKAEILSEVKRIFASSTQNELDQRLSNAAFERRIDAVAELSQSVSPSESTSELPQGVSVGSMCSVILPTHEIVTGKLEIILDGMAGVRLANWHRVKVPVSSLMALLKDAA